MESCLSALVQCAEGIAYVGIFRLGVGGTQRDIPVDALMRHINRRELDGGFPSVGLLLTGIQSLARYTHRTWGGDDGEQWVGVLDVVIKRQIQTVAQRGDISSHVVVDGLLPCQIVVAQAVDDDTGTEYVGHQTVEHIGGIGLVGREVLVARITHRGTQLEHLENAVLLHPLFVVDIPTQTY